MLRKVPACGPMSAKIMIVGEAPGRNEEDEGMPFVGSSGYLLDTMLQEAGLSRQQCWITNVCKYRPPSNELFHFFLADEVGRSGNKPCVNGLFPNELVLEGLAELYKEIIDLKPNIIIPLGNYALWALTECVKVDWDKKHKGFKIPSGIGKWRGSLLPTVVFHDGVPHLALRDNASGRQNIKCLPTYHPAAILRNWTWRKDTVHDLRRVVREWQTPAYTPRPNNFLVRPSFKEAMEWIDAIDLHAPRPLAEDIETRKGHIACLGLATSPHDAICIPFMCTERSTGYWQLEEEVALIRRIKQLNKHPNIQVVGQNFIYDVQYMVRRWGFIFPVHADTMLRQHAMFPGEPKDLAYITSLYADNYVYWKDEGKDWEPSMPEEQLWGYNCLDAGYTYEDYVEQEAALAAYGLQEQARFLQDLFEPILHMMLRGTAIDMQLRPRMGMELLEAMQKREAWFNRVQPFKLAKSKGAKPWFRSNKQQKTLFYDLMRLPVQKNRKTKNPSVDDDALEALMVVEPLLMPLLKTLQEYRSLGVFYNTFVSAPIEHDNRMRCSYNIGGTETYRFSSSKDAFGYGTNLQNIPKGSED